MAPKIQKSKPAPDISPPTGDIVPPKIDIEKAAEGLEETVNEVESGLIGSFSTAMPSEEEQEALRARLRDIANPPQEDADLTASPATQPLGGEQTWPDANFPHHGYPPHQTGIDLSQSVGVLGAENPHLAQKPTVGRIVHFASPEYPHPQAAMITGVHNDTLVDLYVFRRLESPANAARVVEGAPEGRARRWFWPPRV